MLQQKRRGETGSILTFGAVAHDDDGNDDDDAVADGGDDEEGVWQCVGLRKDDFRMALVSL